MQKLTIITINYNHFDGLKRTIDSIVSQTFTNYEWIVVDGGSTDGSKQLLEQYHDCFTWWCSEPDTGVYNAMNKGLAHATGEYVNFMNAGDTFASPTILSEIFTNQHTADILYGWMMRGSINGELNNKPMMKPHINWWDFYYHTLNHQATFTRTVLFKKYGGFDESYKALADWRHFAELICIKRVSYEYLPCKIAIYEGNGISDDVQVYPEEIKRVQKEVYPTIQPDDIQALHELPLIETCKQYRLTRQMYKLFMSGIICILHRFK